MANSGSQSARQSRQSRPSTRFDVVDCNTGGAYDTAKNVMWADGSDSAPTKPVSPHRGSSQSPRSRRESFESRTENRVPSLDLTGTRPSTGFSSAYTGMTNASTSSRLTARARLEKNKQNTIKFTKGGGQVVKDNYWYKTNKGGSFNFGMVTPGRRHLIYTKQYREGEQFAKNTVETKQYIERIFESQHRGVINAHREDRVESLDVRKMERLHLQKVAGQLDASVPMPSPRYVRSAPKDNDIITDEAIDTWIKELDDFKPVNVAGGAVNMDTRRLPNKLRARGMTL